MVYLSDDDIIKAFGLLVVSGEVYDKYHFCFFIDGLDEFDKSRGYTQYRLTQHLLRWTSSPCRNVKLCVTSRQLPIFSKALSPAQRLTIHVFTVGDIKELVRLKLETNTTFQELAKSEKHRCDEIVRQVIQRAEGVFLWVCVLLNQVEESLGNGDSVAMLENIVKSAATELDDFFRNILESIPLRYRKQAFVIFALAMRLENILLSDEGRDITVRAFRDMYENISQNVSLSLSLFSCSYLVEALDTDQNLTEVSLLTLDSLDNRSPHRIFSYSDVMIPQCYDSMALTMVHFRLK